MQYNRAVDCKDKVAQPEILKPLVAIFDLGGVRADGGLIISPLSSPIQDLTGPHPCIVNHSKSMFMSKNINKHYHFLFDTAVDGIFKQLPNS
jgi:hypothetical protein